MKISDILATKGSQVITISPAQTIRDAVLLLEKHNIGGLVVVDISGNLKGIVTERDVIRYAAAHDAPDFSRPVSAIMTRRIITGLPNDDVHSVAHTMTERRFRHLPVVEAGKLVGIVTIGDVVKAQRDSYLGQVTTLQTMIDSDSEPGGMK